MPGARALAAALLLTGLTFASPAGAQLAGGGEALVEAPSGVPTQPQSAGIGGLSQRLGLQRAVGFDPFTGFPGGGGGPDLAGFRGGFDGVRDGLRGSLRGSLGDLLGGFDGRWGGGFGGGYGGRFPGYGGGYGPPYYGGGYPPYGGGYPPYGGGYPPYGGGYGGPWFPPFPWPKPSPVTCVPVPRVPQMDPSTACYATIVRGPLPLGGGATASILVCSPRDQPGPPAGASFRGLLGPEGLGGVGGFGSSISVVTGAIACVPGEPGGAVILGEG